MVYSFTEKKRIRKSFGKIASVAKLPSLLEVQKNSYEGFLNPSEQEDKKISLTGSKIAERTVGGIDAVFKSMFPISDTAGLADLDYISYNLEAPKFDVEECLQKDLTFSAPLKATLRLTVWEKEENSEARKVVEVKDQEIYLCDVPMMTEKGTFVVNGTERVVVSQMHRSPGVFFDHDSGNTHASGKLLFSARVIPFRGSWLDFEFDHKDNMYVRIDRRRKLPATYLLRALGLETDDIINTFYEKVNVRIKSGKFSLAFTKMFYEGIKLTNDLINADTKEVVAEAGKKLTRRALKKLEEANVEWIAQKDEELMGRFIGEAMVDKSSGEVLFDAGSEITEEILEAIKELKLKELTILKVDFLNVGPYIRNTLAIDKTSNRDEALIEIYKVMRPGEPATVEASERLLNGLFFDEGRYALSEVGRMKMNARLGFGEDKEFSAILNTDDVLAIVKKLIEIRDGNDVVDDIDHLGNRRVRSVGELMENQFRIGLLRMDRSIKERMSSSEIATMKPNDLVNARPLSASLREFFASSQLSQFMDQVNPLSEVTHKRRLSALGPGGLTRERAGFEVRDVHPTHYGRICPIETPEGPNIGLINSLSTYARINKYGFIETPYRKVVKGVATEEIVYMSAINEGEHTIAQASTKLDAKGKIVEELVISRRNSETIMASQEQIDLMDVSPQQVISIATALIPFLENDDANRALMGANMMRQAVPLIKAEAPLVGTGIEGVIAADSGIVTIARRDGVIESVDATRIVVRVSGKVAAGKSGVDIYRLDKFRRSNQNSCLNQKVIVKQGEKVKKGDVMADGASTDMGELALGRNVTVAFMPWNGYNFEDSILISERIVRDDVYTSVHINEFNVMSRDTKLGSEEITRDIPNVGEEALKNLDEAGIVRIGAVVDPGAILVGKVTPKGETPMTPEEKLLRAIFGEKAADVRDTSLRLPGGSTGTVVGVKVFNRRGNEKDIRTIEIEDMEVATLTKDINDERRILEDDTHDRLKALILGKKAKAKVGSAISKGAELTADMLDATERKDWWSIKISDDKLMSEIESMKIQLDSALEALSVRREEKIEKIRSSDDLSPGVLQMVKVQVAVKRKLQPGDKMAGRHGNKGVISRILPLEDMPYREDGTPVDIVLNPLGVPSRMNVGQILETHLGWACKGMGTKIGKLLEDTLHDNKDMQEVRKYLEKIYTGSGDNKNIAKMSDEEVLDLARNLENGVPIATPAFDGAKDSDINEALKEAGFDEDGQVQLYDGLSGESFERRTTVGVIYMLKLHHLVDEKIHARSIGPYSLVTQQPLGGKAQFGGQRFGEMEVWALQAYGASYTLQEMLTVKSDDISGRTKTYGAIVRGEDNFEAGIPESFNVLTKEIQALGLDMELITELDQDIKDVNDANNSTSGVLESDDNKTEMMK